MKNLFERFTEPSTYAGLAAALAGFNWSTVAPVGSSQWWLALATVVGGVLGAIVKGGRNE